MFSGLLNIHDQRAETEENLWLFHDEKGRVSGHEETEDQEGYSRLFISAQAASSSWALQ